MPWGVSLARRGCSNAEIAEAFGVSERTVYRWCRAHPEFCQALSESKSKADEAVVDSLYRRACGVTVTEKRESVTERGGVKTRKVEKVTKELPPDVCAMLWWLKNRQPELWRDKPAAGEADTAVLAEAKRLVRSVPSAIG